MIYNIDTTKKEGKIIMLKFYATKMKIYNNKTFICEAYGERTLLDEKDVKDKTVSINWDNLSENYQKFGVVLPFNFFNFKKGRVVSFFDWNPFKKNLRDICEWKTELNITVKITYRDIDDSMSINEVLDWGNTKKAIQYLNERGLKIE